MADSSQHRYYQKRKRVKSQLKSSLSKKEEERMENVKNPKAKKALRKAHPKTPKYNITI